MGVSKRVRLSSKGQLVIPRELRERLGLRPGAELALHLVSDRVFVAEVIEPTSLQEALERLGAEARGRRITPAQLRRAVAQARQEVHRERRPKASDA